MFKSKKKKYSSKELQHEQYSQSLIVIEQRLKEWGNDKLDLLKSFRKIISLDLAYSSIADFSYKNNGNTFVLSMPTYYYDENNKEVDLEIQRQKPLEIDDKYVVHSPYQTSKWKMHLLRKDDLQPEKFTEPGRPNYFPSLNLVLQGNGSVHRTAEAFLNRSNSIALVNIYYDEPLYQHIITDGVDWINKHTGEKIWPVGDFRLALIYELKRKELQMC